MSSAKDSSTPSPDTSTPPDLASKAPVTLNVGGVEFVALRDTLSQSTFFQALLSGRWDGNRLSDGSYFIDWDPKIFSSILNFLRSGRFPNCRNGVNQGFDLTFATELKDAAAYFGVDALHDWLEQGCPGAVEEEYSFKVFELLDPEKIVTERCPGNGTVEHQVSWVTRDVRICPRDIRIHNKDTSLCGQQCTKAHEGGAPKYKQMVVPVVLVIRKMLTSSTA